MKSPHTITILTIIAITFCGLLMAWPRAAKTQPEQEAPISKKEPTIEEYEPKSTLVTKEHKIERAKFPFIDVHSHHWNPTAEEGDRLRREMDTINLRVMVNLSGGTGERLQRTVAVMKGRHPDRFVVF